jgi:hypothetical protein
MGELYSDLDLLNDMVKTLGLHGAMDPKALAREVGRSEETVLEQLTESSFFQPALSGKLGRYELSEGGRAQFDKIS